MTAIQASESAFAAILEDGGAAPLQQGCVFYLLSLVPGEGIESLPKP